MKFTTTILSAGLAASCTAVNLRAQDIWGDIGGGFEDLGNGIADTVTDAANGTADWFSGDFADFWTDDLPEGIEDVAGEVGGATIGSVGSIVQFFDGPAAGPGQKGKGPDAEPEVPADVTTTDRFVEMLVGKNYSVGGTFNAAGIPYSACLRTDCLAETYANGACMNCMKALGKESGAAQCLACNNAMGTTAQN